MEHQILAIGYKPYDYGAVQAMWQKYEMTFDFVDDFSVAKQELLRGRYVGVAVYTALATSLTLCFRNNDVLRYNKLRKLK